MNLGGIVPQEMLYLQRKKYKFVGREDLNLRREKSRIKKQSV
jgi:hypothetical protein